MLWWIAVVLTGYLKSHHATKQEAQLHNGGQSDSETTVVFVKKIKA